MSKKVKLTLEGHQETSADLLEIQKLAWKVLDRLQKAMPLNSKAIKHMLKIRDLVDTDRSDLDDLLYRELPDEATTFIYYPKQEDRNNE